MLRTGEHPVHRLDDLWRVGKILKHHGQVSDRFPPSPRLFEQREDIAQSDLELGFETLYPLSVRRIDTEHP